MHHIKSGCYKAFMVASRYQPTDGHNFLRDWINGAPLKGWDNKPVTWVGIEDARAYATWAGKRLPHEWEWQYAAQTNQLNEWPWQQIIPVTRAYEEVTNTLSVIKIEGIEPITKDLKLNR